jgi:hypothetical protein
MADRSDETLPQIARRIARSTPAGIRGGDTACAPVQSPKGGWANLGEGRMVGRTGGGGASEGRGLLRDVTEGDLPVFFERQLDADANRMAAFTAEDPSDGKAFAAHWNRILADETIVIKTVLFDGRVAGNVSSFAHPTRDKPHELGPEQKGRRS